MEKESRVGIVLMGIYLILLAVTSFSEMFLLKQIPKVIEQFFNNPNIFAQFPFPKKFFFWLILDTFRVMTTVFFVPIACLYLIKLNERARQFILYSSMFIVTTLVIQLVRSYYFSIDLDSNLTTQKLMREYVGVEAYVILDNMAMHVGFSLTRILSYMLPILYLTRPKVKEQFKRPSLINC